MTATSRIQRTIAEFRARLLAQEAKVVRALDAAHKAVLMVIQPRLDALYQQMADAMEEGGELSPSWLYEANRLEAIKQLITGQVDHYGALALMQTGRLQQDGVHLGLDAAMQLLQATVPAGVSWSFGVPSTRAINDLIGMTQAGSPLADLFRGFGKEAATKASEALITGVSLGWNPRRIAPQVEQALGVSRNRALTITRTTALQAYRSAAMETYRANSDVVSKWVWVCAFDDRCCLACLAMNGTEHELDEELDGHPNCRCAKNPKTRDWGDILAPLGIDASDIPDTSPQYQSGADWFEEQDETTQRQVMGNAKYEAWANGDFDLEDIVGKSYDKDWGHSIYEKSLKQLVKGR
jgi:SPP1 gp7 family putative phage head morphogenesis protein